MRTEGKIRVVVRSRKIPVGTFLHTEPVYSASGVLMGSRSSRRVMYGTSLDHENERAIDEAQKLAYDLGLDLEVVDTSKMSVINRFLSRLGRNSGMHPSVVVSLSPSAMAAPSPALPQGC